MNSTIPNTKSKRPSVVVSYLLVLTLTTVCYFVYEFIAVPVIVGDTSGLNRKPRDLTHLAYEIPIDDKSEYGYLFQEDSWELAPCKTMDTAQGKILFKDYKPNDDGSWEVVPCTIIMQSSSEDKTGGVKSEHKAPFVLRSEKGARLRFDNPITMGGAGQSGKLKQAQLLGHVNLYRHDPEQPIQILTSNIQISGKKVFTLDDVYFQFGPNKGHGRNLSLELSHKSGQLAIESDFSKIEGIRKIQLAYLKSLRLEQSPSKVSNSQHPNNRFLATSNAPIEVTCNGSFEFDFVSNRAAFRDQVFVRQLDDSGDSLECEQLDLFFKRIPANEMNSLADKTKSDPNLEGERSSSKFELREIVAAGTPAIIHARSRDARIAGDYLRYDLEQSQVQARSNRLVDVKQGTSQFVAQQLTYDITEDGSLGNLKAMGNGKMTRIGATRENTFVASWQNYLTIRAVDGGQKLVSMDGAATLDIDSQTNIRSDVIKFWLWEVSKLDTDGVHHSWDYQPATLHTTGIVKIASKELTGETRELIAAWPENPVRPTPFVQPQPPVAPTNSFGILHNHSPNLASMAPRRTHVRRVGYQQGVSKPSDPLQFTGDSVRIELRGNQQDTEMTDLEIIGNVHAWKHRSVQAMLATPPPRPEMEIKGDYLHIIPQSKDSYRIKVAGNKQTDAMVDANGMTLQGPSIFLDQTANRMWIEGTGTMKLKPDPNTKHNVHSYVSTGDKAIRKSVDISWQGGMIFDGRKIYFERDVVSESKTQLKNGEIQKTFSQSQALNIVLDHHVDLSNFKQQPSENIKIREMLLVQSLANEKRVFNLDEGPLVSTNHPTPVVLENQTLNGLGDIVEKQKLVGPNATLDVSTNTLTTSGPGSISIHRRGGTPGESSPLGFGLGNRSKSPLPSSDGLTYIQINFDKTLIANSDSREMTIQGNTRAIYSPISNINEELDPDSTGRLKPGAVRMSCDQIQMAQWTPQATGESTSELIATGNTHITSNSFEATANRVSFDQESGIMTMEGTSRRDGNLWTRQDQRSRPSHLIFGKIRYRPSDGFTQIEKANITVRGKR